MSLLNSIKSFFDGSSAVGSVSRDASRVYLVDAEKLADSREGSGRMGPQERFHAIQMLSRFADREKIKLVAVLGGRPLREVAHGEEYNGIRVFYIEADKTMADQIQQVLDRELRGRAVVVTNDKQLETKLIERGVSTLRVSSLRRAMDTNNNGDGGGDGGSNRDRRDRGGRDRDRRGRGPRPDRQERSDRQQTQPNQGNAPEQSATDHEAESAPEERRGGASDTIDSLIDRVN